MSAPFHKKFVSVFYLIVATILFVAVVYITTAQEEVSLGNPPAELAFVSDRDGSWDIFRLKPDGTLLNLTNDGTDAVDLFASWSHDGEAINFLSNRLEADELGPSQVDAEGETIRNLTVVTAILTLIGEQRFNWDPMWSPDGSKILWASIRDLNLELYTIGSDVAFDARNFTRHTQRAARDWFHTWSPDGTQVVFNSDAAGGEDIYVLDLPTGEITPLTATEEEELHAAWTLDGSAIVFASERDRIFAEGFVDLFIMEPDGSDPRPLLDDRVVQMDPLWSKDGDYVAYTSNQEGNWHIYVMQADGTKLRRVTEGDAAHLFPVWRPSGN